MLPATNTKHLPLLSLDLGSLRLALSQSDNGISNGSALWPSSQILAMYLLANASTLRLKSRSVCELGSGVGLVALVLSSLGYNVLATDLPFIIDSVLARNVSSNIPSLPPEHGSIHVSSLDWSQSISWPSLSMEPPFSLVVTSDTVYDKDLIVPLLQTLHNLCETSASSMPLVLLAIDRRDPVLTDSFFLRATEEFGFRCSQLGRKHIVKAITKVLGKGAWNRTDYEYIELWTMRLGPS